jgi:hypothetical protein
MRDKQWEDARTYLGAAASRPIPLNWPESHKKRFLVLLHRERFKLAQQLQDAQLAKSAVSESPTERLMREHFAAAKAIRQAVITGKQEDIFKPARTLVYLSDVKELPPEWQGPILAWLLVAGLQG